MLEVEIPGRGVMGLQHLVLDYNGTLACDGVLLEGVAERLKALTNTLTLHVLTADTFGNVARALEGVSCTLTVIPQGNQAEAKHRYAKKLGFEQTVCMGNGRNDALMLRDAALSVATLQEEGCAVEALMSAQVVVRHIRDGLDLLLNPLRLKATLRN